MIQEYLLLTEGGDAHLVAAQVTTTHDSLKALQDLVGGLIEYVAQDRIKCDVYANEEGLFVPHFGLNLVASAITGRQLVGPVVLASSDNAGNTTSLSTDVIKKLERDGLMIQDELVSVDTIHQEYPNTYAHYLDKAGTYGSL